MSVDETHADRHGSEDTEAASNRGKRAHVAANGEVSGSGAGAGGGGNPEDYDDDPQGGGGSLEQGNISKKPASGADAPKHGSR